MKVKSFSHIQPPATAGTAAHQAPPSMGVSRQEYWSGVPLPSRTLFPRFIEIPIKKLTEFFPVSVENCIEINKYFVGDIGIDDKTICKAQI